MSHHPPPRRSGRRWKSQSQAESGWLQTSRSGRGRIRAGIGWDGIGWDGLGVGQPVPARLRCGSVVAVLWQCCAVYALSQCSWRSHPSPLDPNPAVTAATATSKCSFRMLGAPSPARTLLSLSLSFSLASAQRPCPPGPCLALVGPMLQIVCSVCLLYGCAFARARIVLPVVVVDIVYCAHQGTHAHRGEL